MEIFKLSAVVWAIVLVELMLLSQVIED